MIAILRLPATVSGEFSAQIHPLFAALLIAAVFWILVWLINGRDRDENERREREGQPGLGSTIIFGLALAYIIRYLSRLRRPLPPRQPPQQVDIHVDDDE
ncbi:hypothetical protein [Halomontanus rarus]|uniref:hypothetical protein n=1 Tax=Halomontanus rarus TaxID=3034020 RepID=UPI001A99D309